MPMGLVLVHEADGSYLLEDVELDASKVGEVLIRNVTFGKSNDLKHRIYDRSQQIICHSQINLD